MNFFSSDVFDEASLITRKPSMTMKLPASCWPALAARPRLGGNSARMKSSTPGNPLFIRAPYALR